MLLADWMRINGVTQVKLAEDSGVGQSYISEYLAGNKFPEKYGKPAA
jgi:transcriptional regulator with XRE-family HTH domain